MPRSASPSSSPARRRSRSRSRSRSPRAKPLRSRSRSRSHSRSRNRSASSGAESDASSTRRHRRKRSHKSERKLKRHKHKKKIRDNSDDGRDNSGDGRDNSGDGRDDANDSAATGAAAVQEPRSQEPTPADDVRSFFERVRAQEAAKDPVGTVHASGVRVANPTARVALEQWECVKRGCGEKNPKRAAACGKCGAMKRLSEWR